ncbi:MAG: glycosyltransferase family 4 protein [Muribaculaceae bacterium]|nr:glycosyltransferase family 4 protein [Muribaculaceae bacterium]
MKIDVIVSSIIPGGGITNFVAQLCKALSCMHSLRLIVTHEEVRKEQVVWFNIFLSRGLIDISKSYKFWRYIQLINIWRKDTPDCIINNYNAVGQYVLPLLSKKVRNLHIVHGITSDFKRVATINKAYTSHWVVPSRKTAELIMTGNRSVKSECITLIPHGVEEVTKDTIPVHRLYNKLVLIYVGVLEEHKGVDILPDVVKELERRNISYQFNIIGEGSLRERISRNLASEIADGKVRLYGTIKHKEVLKMFTQSDILVYPTRIDSFGLVIVESMMAGCVPIVGRIAGVTDQIIDNTHDGFLVSVKAEDIIQKIYSLSQDTSLLKRMSEQARYNASAHYSLTVMIEAYNKLLTKLL